MRRPGILLVLIVLMRVLASALAAATTEESTATLDPFDKVRLYRERARPARVVLLLSDANGWHRADVERARALASLDALVVGVDVQRLFGRRRLGEFGGDYAAIAARILQEAGRSLGAGTTNGVP